MMQCCEIQSDQKLKIMESHVHQTVNEVELDRQKQALSSR